MSWPETSLTFDLAILTTKIDELQQKLFWNYKEPEADDAIADTVRTIRDLNAKARKIEARLTKINNDAIAETVASIIAEMREQ